MGIKIFTLKLLCEDFMPSTKACDQGKSAFKKDCVIHQIKAGIKLSHIEATMTHAGKAGLRGKTHL